MLFLNQLSFVVDIFSFLYNNFLKVHNNVELMTVIQEMIHIVLTVQSSLQIQNPMCFYDFLIYESFSDIEIKD